MSSFGLVLDCSDPDTLADFWSAALGRPLDDQASSDFASIGLAAHRDTTGWTLADGDGPTWLFARVPEPKTAKNRMHVDMAVPDPEAEVDRLVALGATRVADVDEDRAARLRPEVDPDGVPAAPTAPGS